MYFPTFCPLESFLPLCFRATLQWDSDVNYHPLLTGLAFREDLLIIQAYALSCSVSRARGTPHEAIGVDWGRNNGEVVGASPTVHLCVKRLLGLVQMCCFHLKVESCCACSVLFFTASCYTQFVMAISRNTVFGSPVVTCSVSTLGSSSQPVFGK